MAKSKKWIAGVRAGMKRRGTVGAFTRQAKRAGKSPQRYAAQVLGDPSKHTARTVRRARFARTMGELGARRSGKKLPPILKVARPAKPARRRRRKVGKKRAA